MRTDEPPFRLITIWFFSFLVAFANAAATGFLLGDYYAEPAFIPLLLTTWFMLNILMTLVVLINRYLGVEEPFFLFCNSVVLCTLVSGVSSFIIMRDPVWFDYNVIAFDGYWVSYSAVFLLHYTKGLLMVSGVTVLLLISQRISRHRKT